MLTTPRKHRINSFLLKLPNNQTDQIIFSHNLPNKSIKMPEPIKQAERELRKQKSEPSIRVSEFHQSISLTSTETEEETADLYLPLLHVLPVKEVSNAFVKKNQHCHCVTVETLKDSQGFVIDENGNEAEVEESENTLVRAAVVEDENYIRVAVKDVDSLARTNYDGTLVQRNAFEALLTSVSVEPIKIEQEVDSKEDEPAVSPLSPETLLPNCTLSESYNWLSDIKRLAKITSVLKKLPLEMEGKIFIKRASSSPKLTKTLKKWSSLRAELRGSYLLLYPLGKKPPVAYLCINRALVDLEYNFTENNVIHLSVDNRSDCDYYLRTESPEDAAKWALALRKAVKVPYDAFIPVGRTRSSSLLTDASSLLQRRRTLFSK